MARRRLIPVLLLTIAALTVAACRGGDDELPLTNDETTPPAQDSGDDRDVPATADQPTSPTVREPTDVTAAAGEDDDTPATTDRPSAGGGTTVPSSDGTTPAVTSDGTYTVQAGDTLGDIAFRFGTTAAVLADLNNLENPNALTIGQVLVLPGGQLPAEDEEEEEEEEAVADEQGDDSETPAQDAEDEEPAPEPPAPAAGAGLSPAGIPAARVGRNHGHDPGPARRAVGLRDDGTALAPGSDDAGGAGGAVHRVEHAAAAPGRPLLPGRYGRGRPLQPGRDLHGPGRAAARPADRRQHRDLRPHPRPAIALAAGVRPQPGARPRGAGLLRVGCRRRDGRRQAGHHLRGGVLWRQYVHDVGARARARRRGLPRRRGDADRGRDGHFVRVRRRDRRRRAGT